MRRSAIVLALGVAVLDLILYVCGEARLSGSLGSVFQLGVGAFASRLVVTLTFTLPWVVGASLLWHRRRALGAAVVVPTTLLTLPTVLRVAQTGIELVGDGGDAAAWTEFVGGAALWLLAVGAGVTAWLARPAAGNRLEAPGVGNVYVVLAFLAWLPMVLASTQFLAPGAVGTDETARHFYEFVWEASTGVGTVIGVSEAVLFGGLLLLGPAVRRDAAGAVVLTVVLPALTREIQTIVEVAGESFVISTPASFVGTIGLLGLAIIAIRWLVRGAPAASDAARAAEGNRSVERGSEAP
jgi:hypothetical protein